MLGPDVGGVNLVYSDERSQTRGVLYRSASARRAVRPRRAAHSRASATQLVESRIKVQTGYWAPSNSYDCTEYCTSKLSGTKWCASSNLALAHVAATKRSTTTHCSRTSLCVMKHEACHPRPSPSSLLTPRGHAMLKHLCVRLRARAAPNRTPLQPRACGAPAWLGSPRCRTHTLNCEAGHPC